MKKYALLFSLISCFSIAYADQPWEDYKAQTVPLQQQIYGWCSPEKTLKLMDLVHDTQANLIVEIGVFGGSSLYPMAAALKYQNHGLIYGVDPWDKDCSLEGYEKNTGHISFWGSTDHEEMYRYFINVITTFGVENFTKTMRMTSKTAATKFNDETIDLLHIDGNHSEEGALADVQMFFPKLKTGGYLMFDDANWNETRHAINFLNNSPNCKIDLDRSIPDGWLVYRKI